MWLWFLAMTDPKYRVVALSLAKERLRMGSQAEAAVGRLPRHSTSRSLVLSAPHMLCRGCRPPRSTVSVCKLICLQLPKARSHNVTQGWEWYSSSLSLYDICSALCYFELFYSGVLSSFLLWQAKKKPRTLPMSSLCRTPAQRCLLVAPAEK